ncbi:carboxymethylenebutenolidase homolog [Glandiceps talaboti]
MACKGPCKPGDIRKDVVTKGEVVEINSNVKAYLARPSGQPKAAVLVINDIFGYELPANRVIADNLAQHGYTALLPDLFRNDPWDVNMSPMSPSSNFPDWLAKHKQDRVDGDIDASLEYIHDKLGISIVGAIGFCWGGKQVVLASRKSSVRFKVAVGFYAVRLDVNDAVAMKTPTMLIFGEQDSLTPMQGIAEIEKAMKDCNRLITTTTSDVSKLDGPAVRVKIFKDVGHGFVHRGDRSDPIVDAAANEAIDDMYEWLEKFH